MSQGLSVREVVTAGLTALPAVNSRLSLMPVEGSAATAYGQVVEVPTRVEDLHLQVGDRRGSSTAELVIAQPVFAGNLEAEQVGAQYVLRWLTDRGVHEVTGRYLGRRRVGPVLIGWRMGISGPVTRVQRRAHARVAVTVPVQVELPVPPAADDREDVGDAAGSPVVLTGITVNVSEGGLLATLQPSPSGVAVPASGTAVVVRFVLAQEPFDLAGRVVRHQGADGLAVAFDDPNGHGDRLRPLLFAHQLKARRLGVLGA